VNVAVIGSGPGGYVASIKAAQLGADVTVIEEKEVGGTCVNWGCIPTKSLLASSEMFSMANNLDEFGIELNGTITPNFLKILKRKDTVVNTQIRGIKNLFKSWNITLKEGHGKLLSPGTIEVLHSDGSIEIVRADKTIIATGSSPSPLPDFPFDGKMIISSTDALKLADIPKSILIIGAGIIGCEFACIFNALGSSVSLVEILPRIMPSEDDEISELLEREMKKRHIHIYLNTIIKKIESRHNGMFAVLEAGQNIMTEKILVAVGRNYNTHGLGLEEIGIQKGKHGEVNVNEEMETNVPGIYAIGDVVGGYLLAHVASREGITAAKNIMGMKEKIDYTVVPSAIFTSPEIGSVGIKEYQAREKGIKVKKGYFQFKSLGKAHVMGEIAGFIKMLSDEHSGKILGVHIIGPHASDLIHEGALAIKKGLRARDMAETIHAHPTLSEGLMEAAGDMYGEAIHVIRNGYKKHNN
jgi:dihydrolipoamide dehydrogenase